MSTRIGIASWLMGKRPIVERLTWAAENGFTAISFEIGQMSAEGDKAIGTGAIDAIGELSLDVTVHLSPGMAEPPEKRQPFIRAVKTTAQLQKQTGRVRCVSIDPAWRATSHVSYDPDWTLEALDKIVRAVDDPDVLIAVENWKINPERDEFIRLADSLPGTRLGMLLDLGHLHVMNEDPVEAASDLPLPVYEVHVSDNNGTSDDHLPLGKGSLPIDGIAEKIAAKHPDCIWTLEMRPDYHMHKCCISKHRARQSILSTHNRLSQALQLAGSSTA